MQLIDSSIVSNENENVKEGCLSAGLFSSVGRSVLCRRVCTTSDLSLSRCDSVTHILSLLLDCQQRRTTAEVNNNAVYLHFCFCYARSY